MTKLFFSCRQLRAAMYTFVLLAAPAGAEPLDRTISVSYQTENGMVETRALPAGAGATVLGQGQKQPQIHTQDPSQPTRLLVRLKDQPLQPYLQRLRTQQAADPKTPAATRQKQLAKAAQSHQQRLQKSQSQVLSDLRRKQVLDKVHHQFIRLTNTLAITTKASNLEEIRKLPQVAAVYPDNPVTALLEHSVAKVGAHTVWTLRDNEDKSITGAGITVAILDTGIDYRHPDLGGCLGAGCKIVGGFNFVEGEDSTDPMDYEGHGTHVAGIVAANGTLRGVAPDAKLYAFKVLDNNGNGMDSAIIAGLERAVDPDGDPLTDDQVDVINMSLGGWGGADSPVSEAANAAMNAGIIVVVAAGNEGSGYSTIGSPGNAAQVITVGATDDEDVIAPFSSRGPVLEVNYVKPELVAPGVDINSAAPGGGYAVHSGTSMAAPHVAGGAALLKQLHPDLTPQEIKSLLIANTRDIGLDIFTQGSGRMDLIAAANADLIISSPLLSFGYVDIEQPLWQASLPFTFKNISSQQKAFTVSAPESLPAGTEFELPAGGNGNLEPGESKNINIGIRVNTEELPFSDLITMHHESSFKLGLGTNVQRIPFAFVKAAKLKIHYAQIKFADIFIFSDDGQFTYRYFGASCSADSESTLPDTFYVRPDVYSAVVAYPSDDKKCWIKDNFIFKENLSVTDTLSVDIQAAEAKNKIAVAGIVDDLGHPVAAGNLSVSDMNINWFHPPSRTVYSAGSRTDTLRIAQVSDFSDKFKVNVSALIKNTDSASDDSIHYLTQGNFQQGLSSSFDLALDTRDAGKLVFDYSDRAMLSEGVTLGVNARQTISSAEYIAFTMMNSLDITPRYNPFKATVYSQLATFEIGEWYPDLWVSRHSDEWIPFWELMLVETGPIAFLDSKTFAKIKGVFSFRDILAYQNKNNDLPIAHSAYFLSSYIYYSSSFKQVGAMDNSNCIGCFGLQKDQAHNLFHDLMPYALRCDGELLEEGETSGVNYLSALPNGDCAEITLEFQLRTRLFGRNDTSTVMVTLNTSSSDSFDYLLIESPIIDELTFVNDGEVSRILNGENAKIVLKVGTDRFGRRPAQEPKVTLEHRLDDDADWQPLSVEKENDIYTAMIPVIEGAHRGSVRVAVEDAHSNRVVQTLNSVFLLGKDALSLTRKPPVFGALPVLIVEATGALTNYTLPDVTAQDAEDGVITAATENLGPYALGEHDIRWTAANSGGMIGSATQRLIITDTTAPSVVAPANIIIRATGAQTDVELGVATATDLVDGVVDAWSDRSGPFAIGTHLITWNAADNAGNVGRAVQTITINAAPVATPAPTPAGKSSGGGFMGLWIWMLLAGSLSRFHRKRKYLEKF